MAKYCPSCKYGPVGPYIDNCPICGEPVRHSRGLGERVGGGGGMPLWGRVLLGVGVSVALSVGGCCVVGAWRLGNVAQNIPQQMQEAMKQMEEERKARTVVVSAADLLKAFAADPAAAERKYHGKYLELTGVVERSEAGRDREAFAVLHAGDPAAPVKIECFFDYGATDLPDPGETVTLRGEYGGRVSHFQLRQCVRVKRPATATPATPPAP